MDRQCLKNSFKLKKTFKFNVDLIKNYNEENDKRYILEVYVKYPKRLHNLEIYLLFLSERMKIKKYNKLVCNLYDKIV